MALLGHATGMLKAGGAAAFGLLTGAAMMYGRAAVEKVSKVQPLANFSVADTDGLKVTFQNQATGDSGWWDFGDGSALEPFVVDAQVVHTYQKPGTYSAKLTVRNFLMEEKDRSVPVTVDASSSPAPNKLPLVTLKVEPVGRSVAPATYRVSGSVENVERAFLDLGDRVVVVEPGPIDRFEVIDRPTKHPLPIQLIGHSGKQVVKQSATVEVTEDRAANGVSALVRTVDAGTRTERATWTETASVAAAKGAKTFDKVVPARPGHAVTEAKLGPLPKGVKGVKAAVAGDKQSVRLTGEWDGASDALLPLSLVADRIVPVEYPQTAAAGLDANGVATVALPPRQRDMKGLTRRVAVELRMAGPDGRPTVIASTPDLKGKWEMPTRDGRVIRAEQVGEQVRVTVGR